MTFKSFLARILPRTLLWQTFLLIALLMALSLSAWYGIFNYFAAPQRAKQSAQFVISVANLTRAAFLAADESRRVGLLRELNSEEGIRLYPAEDNDRTLPLPQDTLYTALIQTVRAKLGSYTRFARSVNGEEGFYVSLRLDESVTDDDYWIKLPAERIARAHTLEWLGWACAALSLALLGAYFIVMRITRPLRALRRAARQIGRGELPAPLAEDGAQELAAMAQAFNQMSADLAQLESDRALILAGVSHDLRTPLARLRLGIEFSGAPEEDIQAMAGDIEDMEHIIAQFMDFARNPDEEKLEEIDLITDVIRPLQESYARHDLPIQWHIPTQLPCKGKAPALKRAASNLINNALRYAIDAQNKPLPVDVSVKQENSWIVICVADRGPGIPINEIERLKRPFTRLEEARSNTQGSGLGLAIVERIMRAHEGQFNLQPREGSGVNACLKFPVSSFQAVLQQKNS